MVSRSDEHVDSTASDQTPTEPEALYEKLRHLHGKNDELIRRHFEAGVSLHGTDPRYPGEIVEFTPDGHAYIVRRDGDKVIRVREVSA